MSENILSFKTNDLEDGSNFKPEPACDFNEEPTINTSEKTGSIMGRVGNFVRQQKAKLAMGATAVSLAATFTLEPTGKTIDSVKDVAPWVVGGVAVSEVAFVSGAAMMLGAIGGRIGNPLKIKEKIPELANRANSSKLFKAGFWINTTGAVGDFLVIAPAVITKLPPQSWGVAGFTLADLGVTYAVRKTIWNGIEKNKTAV